MIITILALILALLYLAVPGVFSIAFFLWWRRLRHWSFGLLSAACALSVVGQLFGILAKSIPRFGQTQEGSASAQDIMALMQAGIALYVLMGVLLLIGAFGLLSAAQDDFLLDDAKENSIPAA